MGGAVSAFKYIHGEKVNLNLDLQGSNTINTTSNTTYGVRLSSCNVTMQGEGSLNIKPTDATIVGFEASSLTVNLPEYRKFSVDVSHESASRNHCYGINAGTGASPKTGEGQSLVLWLALAYLSSCVLAGLAITGKQKRRAKKLAATGLWLAECCFLQAAN